MSRTHKNTTVRMPADEKLHPAHIVAIRPDVDGMFAKRGEYVLSVQTPAGTRNVVMPVDGTVNVHTRLMQELEPQTALFSVVQLKAEPTPRPKQKVSARQREAASMDVPKHASAGAASRSSNRGWGFIAVAFCCLALALAAFLPGVVFGVFENTNEVSWPFFGVALGVGFLLLVTIRLLSRVRFLGVRAIGGTVASVSVLVFAGLVGLGILLPQVRDIQKTVGDPFASFALEQLQRISSEIGLAGLWPLTPRQNVISLPVSNSFLSGSFEPKVGEVILVGFNFCPIGWAEANGQLMDIAQNTALFSLFGTYYGGDGRTTFGLPDLRGRAPMHVDNSNDSFVNGMGQRKGTESIVVAKGSDQMQISTPILAMNYCIALFGDFPARS